MDRGYKLTAGSRRCSADRMDIYSLKLPPQQIMDNIANARIFIMQKRILCIANQSNCIVLIIFNEKSIGAPYD
jgi:hypothetical protein